MSMSLVTVKNSKIPIYAINSHFWTTFDFHMFYLNNRQYMYE